MDSCQLQVQLRTAASLTGIPSRSQVSRYQMEDRTYGMTDTSNAIGLQQLRSPCLATTRTLTQACTPDASPLTGCHSLVQLQQQMDGRFTRKTARWIGTWIISLPSIQGLPTTISQESKPRVWSISIDGWPERATGNPLRGFREC